MAFYSLFVLLNTNALPEIVRDWLVTNIHECGAEIFKAVAKSRPREPFDGKFLHSLMNEWNFSKLWLNMILKPDDLATLKNALYMSWQINN